MPLESLRARAGEGRPPDFAAALCAPPHGPGVALIAEVKRASPSRGDIAPIPDVAALASAYVRGGAAAVSVLTEPHWFKGGMEDLRAVTVAVVGTPVLRKDFVVDPYQVWEARAAGAAAVLLIVAALPEEALGALMAECAAAGLGALVETHDEAEVEAALRVHEAAGAPVPLVVGVNARNLSTLEVDRGRFAALRAALPRSAVAVAESGIGGPADVPEFARAGADAVLVGEHLARASDPEAAAAALVAAGRLDRGPAPPAAGRPPAARSSERPSGGVRR